MGCCQCVPHAHIGLIEKFGRFDRLAEAGCHCLNPCCGESLMGPVSLRIQQLDVSVETKTKDNVFLTVHVSVQFEVMPDKVRDAFYKLSDPRIQCRSYVNDALRSSIPRLITDDVFTTKDEIAREVKAQLETQMAEFGLHILATLITDIRPDARVKESMNEINAATRLRIAATDKAEAQKIGTVKAAEAEAESKYLAGVGVASQRRAIVGGLRDSILHFSDRVQGIDPKEVMDLVLITQYFDTLKDLGHNRRHNSIFIPHSPSSVSEISAAIRKGFQDRSHDPSHPPVRMQERAVKVRSERLAELQAGPRDLLSLDVGLPSSLPHSPPLLPQSPPLSRHGLVTPACDEDE